jgi:transcriptional regulator with XRE-family HTH domain
MRNEPDIRWLIRALRRRTGLTQEKLAGKLGVAFPTLNRWENRRARPSPLALKQIEQCLRDLGTDGEDLLQAFLGQPESPRNGHTLRGTMAAGTVESEP